MGAMPLLQASGAGSLRQRTRSALVVAEVALAVVLLVGAALFIGSFMSLVRIDPGFDPRNVLTAQISPRVGTVTVEPDFSPAFTDLLERVRQVEQVGQALVDDGDFRTQEG